MLVAFAFVVFVEVLLEEAWHCVPVVLVAFAVPAVPFAVPVSEFIITA